MPTTTATKSNTAPGFARKPEHVVALRPADKRVTVKLGGEVIAESNRAVLCEQSGHDPVYYVPMTDTPRQPVPSDRHPQLLPVQGQCKLLVGHRWGCHGPRRRLVLRPAV